MAKKQKSTYELREGFRLPVAGQVVGREVEALKKAGGGMVRPADVVEAARPEAAPLHPCLEWRDEVAAEKFREHQAGYIIRSYYIVEDVADGGEPERTIANVSVCFEGDDPPTYVSTARAMSDDEMREQVVAEVVGMLRGVWNRSRHLPGMREVFLEAVERLGIEEAAAV